MAYSPTEYDVFIYELDNGRTATNVDGVICERSARFDAECAVTTVFVYLSGDWWTWQAVNHGEIHDAYWECAKDTWGEAARDAYYELLKHHWI